MGRRRRAADPCADPCAFREGWAQRGLALGELCTASSAGLYKLQPCLLFLLDLMQCVPYNSALFCN